jgi:glycolate oxidase FAD binding subunit
MSSDVALLQVREQVRAAAARDVPLCIRGGGTKDFLGESRVGEVLDLSAVAGIVDYDPSELVITLRAGTPLAEVEALLATRGQCLAFEPPSFGLRSTIGGVVAAGLAGPRRASVGGIRDFVLGARLLSAEGEVLGFGGRVMKNVAGFDLSRLVCGSLGILGPIVELSLKVLPVPALERTLEFGMSAAEAVAEFNRWSRLPLPLSASSWFAGRACVRLSGVAPAVDAACAALGGRVLPVDEAGAWWDSVRHHRQPLLAAREPLWRLSLPSTTAALPLSGSLLIEWAGALRWLRTDEDPARVRALAAASGGAAARWYGAPGEAMFDPLPPAALAVQRRLKAAFDPRGLFNRGRLVAAL